MQYPIIGAAVLLIAVIIAFVLGRRHAGAAQPMADKLRPNVLLLATLAAALTFVFGAALIDKVAVLPSQEVLALLVGIGVGGIMTLAGQVATDPPPPTVPKDTADRLIAGLLSAANSRQEEEAE